MIVIRQLPFISQDDYSKVQEAYDQLDRESRLTSEILRSMVGGVGPRMIDNAYVEGVPIGSHHVPVAGKRVLVIRIVGRAGRGEGETW